MILKVFFISFVESNYSRTGVLLKSVTPGFQKFFVQVRYSPWSMACDLFKLKKSLSDDSLLVVMSPSHKVTFLARVITRKNVYLDAGWPMIDGVLSRGVKLSRFPYMIYTYILDFISFHSARTIFVESEVQLNRIKNVFKVPHNRLRVGFTGLNETAFLDSHPLSPRLIELREFLEEKGFNMTALFRGQINNEAGISNILEAARVLADEVAFVFITGSREIVGALPPNCIQFLNVTNFEMKQIYESVDLTIGQISTHPRLNYTIPHKAFEAGYFEKCYITTRTASMQELYPVGTVCYLDHVSVDDLVLKIRALNSIQLRKRLENLIGARYQVVASQDLLGMQFMNFLKSDYSR